MKTDPNSPINPSERLTYHLGLTKREYFAALAMQAHISHYGSADPATVAKQAVKAADALITALNNA